MVPSVVGVLYDPCYRTQPRCSCRSVPSVLAARWTCGPVPGATGFVGGPVQHHHLGDGALLVDLGDASPATTARARALAAVVMAAAIPGFRDAVPAYRTLLLRLDPLSEAADALPALIERLAATI